MPQILLIAAGGLFVILWVIAAGVLIAPRAKLPISVRFVSGGVLVSTSIFVVLIAHAGYLFVWLALGTMVIAVALRRLRLLRIQTIQPMSWWFRILFTSYGLVYLVYAFAPEIQADAITYHLGLVYEYVRLHSFSTRVEFYELLPHGVEMLFVPAFAIGAHSATKLVHFSFLVAAVSIIRHIGRELNLPDSKVCCAAAIFFIAPVTAITSTSAYTDTALVGCCCCLLYLAVRWERARTTGLSQDLPLLLLAGLNAGFCYAIKPTFGSVTAVALAFLVIRSSSGKKMTAAMFLGTAAVAILPWTIRSAVLTANPFAPFLNAWIPNGAFTPQLEARLMSSYNAFRPSFFWHTALLDYTILGGNQGIFGPAFLLLPLALLALRTKSGRWLNAAAFLLAIPVLWNTGTRFLMPSAAIASIALASVLPAPGAIALLAIQMIGSANPVIDLYDTRHDWRLRDVPLRAALRVQSEHEYLAQNIPDFANNGMIAAAIPESARLFALANVHQAYLPREVLVYWQSALADRILDSLVWAQQSWGTRASLLSWTWPAGMYRSVRVTAASDMRIVEGQFDPSGLAATLDQGRSVCWTPWKAGESFNLRAPPGGTGADLLIWPGATALTRLQAQSPKGDWLPIENMVQKNAVTVDIRRDVTAFIRRSGYQYILVPEEKGPFAFIGKDLYDHPGDWGVRPAVHVGDVWLFYITGGLT